MLCAAAIVAAQPPQVGSVDRAARERVLEIRSYNLKAGVRGRFHGRFERVALPMLRRHEVDVVSYGPSLHDADSYYLMRSYDSLAEREKSENAFYGSDEWKKGPREAVLADIESYTTVVIGLDDPTLQGLRGKGAKSMNVDTETMTELERLNADYINSVQRGDVTRFDQILASDFLCSLPDGRLIDRAQFLQITAQPVTIKNLQAHEVNIRVMGEMAIVHARTTYTMADGRPGTGRYTDVWARRDGHWLAVSAHVTRLP